MKIKFICFDLDGVLVDSKMIHFNAFNAALEAHGVKALTLDEHLKRYDGLNTRAKIKKMAVERQWNEDVVDSIYRTKQIRTIEMLKDIEPNPNMNLKLLFQGLKADGYKLGVASNAVSSTVRETLNRLGLNEFLDVVFSNEDVRRGKPASEIYLRACLATNVDPVETLIVEDSPVGLQAANASGCHVLAVDDSTSWGKADLRQAIDKAEGKRSLAKWVNRKATVVIPMAGLGSRFEKAGYTFPKPLIEVGGKPMIQVVVENLGIDAHFVFIAQRVHIEKYNLRTLMNLIAPDSTIIPIDGVTEGAACTVLQAIHQIDNRNPLIIANSDQFLEWDSNEFYYMMQNSQLIDGSIVTFKATHPKWSFAKLDADGFVTQVAEKNPISDIATVGVYYFKHGWDFCAAADEMIKANDRTNGEFYVAPVFNHSIRHGMKYKTYNIERMWGLGTPEDLRYFQENYRGVF